MMKLQIDSRNYEVDLDCPLDISLPLTPNGKNVNCYYASPPESEVIRSGDFVGSVKEGGSVNYQQLSITPHGNGTHTECYGHISADEMTIYHALKKFHFMACLISVKPEKLSNHDQIITRKDIEDKITKWDFKALILRTLPNTDKMLKQYSGTNPPYLLPEIGHLLVEKKIEHLLVDLPSVDRENDQGKLAMHKSFWNYPVAPRKHATITELIYVPDSILDGKYLLNLQIMSLNMDASPSKPVLFEIKNTNQVF